MTDFSSPGAPGDNAPPFSVSELSGALKRTVEDAFGYVRVRGELGRVTIARSGHCYTTLKDDKANLDGVAWKGTVARFPMVPEEGMEVIVTGKLTTYPGRSAYQIVIETMELAGEGALLKLLEERKRKLTAEGLFAQERKRPIPFLPKVIGVVTSPTGAVIRDILHRLQDRFPRHVLLWPVVVQGEKAAEQVSQAIAGFNALSPDGSVPRPDLLIVARGGGSLEDLMAFNEESVVRAAAASDIPLISAVGHETDTTLIDFASDRRAPTPTAAAEMAVPVRREVLAQVQDDGARLEAGLSRLFEDRRMRLEGLARGLPDLDRLLGEAAQRLDDRSERLSNALPALVREKEQSLARISAGLRIEPLKRDIARQAKDLATLSERASGAYGRRLENLSDRLSQFGERLTNASHESVLKRGFVLATDGEGKVVTDAAALQSGQGLSLQFRDGQVSATVGEAGAAVATSPPKPVQKPKKTPAKSSSKSDTRQQDLF